MLDHPRRCFVYLFPSHQTWFLLTVLVILKFAGPLLPCSNADAVCSMTDWFFFLVLDIGNPEIEQVPLGTRFVIGLLQAFAVRAAGFATVSLNALAPAVKCVSAFLWCGRTRMLNGMQGALRDNDVYLW